MMPLNTKHQIQYLLASKVSLKDPITGDSPESEVDHLLRLDCCYLPMIRVLGDSSPFRYHFHSIVIVFAYTC